MPTKEDVLKAAAKRAGGSKIKDKAGPGTPPPDDGKTPKTVEEPPAPEGEEEASEPETVEEASAPEEEETPAPKRISKKHFVWHTPSGPVWIKPGDPVPDGAGDHLS